MFAQYYIFCISMSCYFPWLGIKIIVLYAWTGNSLQTARYYHFFLILSYRYNIISLSIFRNISALKLFPRRKKNTHTQTRTKKMRQYGKNRIRKFVRLGTKYDGNRFYNKSLNILSTKLSFPSTWYYLSISVFGNNTG